jgi:monoamine oxidase
MKKAGGVIVAAVVGGKLLQTRNKKNRHKNYELAKPYLPTMNEEKLLEFAKDTAPGKKTCVVIGGGVAGVASAYELCEKGHNVVLLERASGAGLECSAAPAGGMQRSNPTVDSSMWIAAVKSITGLAPFRYFRIDFWETLTDPQYLRWFAGFSHNGFIVSDVDHKFYQKQLLSFTNWAIDDIMSIISKKENVKKKHWSRGNWCFEVILR